MENRVMKDSSASKRLQYAKWWTPFRQIMNYIFLRPCHSKAIYCLPLAGACTLIYLGSLIPQIPYIGFRIITKQTLGLDLLKAVGAIHRLTGILGLLATTGVAGIFGQEGRVTSQGWALSLQMIGCVMAVGMEMFGICMMTWYTWQRGASINVHIHLYPGGALNRDVAGSAFVLYYCYTVLGFLLGCWIRWKCLDYSRMFFRQLLAGECGWTVDAPGTHTKSLTQADVGRDGVRGADTVPLLDESRQRGSVYEANRDDIDV
eukprot:GHVO01005796.1.p1 GENE.GHVO01005796.1~~GHVO01005796.1.p1  ORF type:complete len:271 (+),score=23.21 GHVO01005796.1:33-815(+)